MAILDNTNVGTANIIISTDVQQLYTALGTGNPGTITGLVMTGSLQGNATTATLATSATTATTATTATNANFPRITNNPVNTNTYSVVFADAPVGNAYDTLYVDSGSTGGGGAGGGMFYTPSTDTLQVTSSYAVTASYALNGGGGGGSTLELRTTPNSNPGVGATTQIMNAFGGLWDPSVTGGQGVDLFNIFGYSPTTLGNDIIVTATSAPDPSSPVAEVVGVVMNLGGASPILEFYDAAGSICSKPVSYHGWIKP